MRRPRHVLTAFVVVSVVGGAGLGLAARSSPEPALDPARAAQAIFKVRGKVLGLYPGKVTFMKLRIRNAHRFPIKVRSIRSRVGDGAAGCTGSNVRIKRVRDVVVPASSSRRVQVRVTMRRAAPDACAGARLPISFSGRAVRA